jgi:hypothetical protein
VLRRETFATALLADAHDIKEAILLLGEQLFLLGLVGIGDNLEGGERGDQAVFQLGGEDQAPVVLDVLDGERE